MNQIRLWISGTVLLISSLCVAKWPTGTEPFATAQLAGKSGSQVSGTIDIGKSENGLLIRVYAKNLTAGSHGIHLHEKGDCSSADAKSAGDHFNPTENRHGAPKAAQHHLGDFGNIVSNAQPDQMIEVQIPSPAKGFDWAVILGKSVVIHKDKDDLASQPAGNSGDRIACGVLTKVSVTH